MPLGAQLGIPTIGGKITCHQNKKIINNQIIKSLDARSKPYKFSIGRALFAGESNGVNVLADEVPNRGEGEKPHIWSMAGCGY
ncbi:hypothetical protein AAE002_004002 [Salmonella enterica]